MKWALVHLGSDIVYGLTFFAGELLKNNHSIHWFDGDREDIIDRIKDFNPNYVCFGPLSSEFEIAIKISNRIKESLPNVLTVFGGHHVQAMPEELENNTSIDYLVLGPCYNIIEQILLTPSRSLIKGSPIDPSQMVPALEEYYTQIERIGKRPRTFLMSHFGCVYNCSYCCTDIIRKTYGSNIYKNFWLTRRPINNIISEAKVAKKFGMKEIMIGDDDFLRGVSSEGTIYQWIKNFAEEWKKHIDIPITIQVTPMTVIKTDIDILKIISSLTKTVQMGLQTFDEGSKKLFNRSYQNETQMFEACKRLVDLGIKIKLDTIIGLPNIDGLVPDPIEDAIHTIQACQRLSNKYPGMIKTQCFNLVLFPGTKLWNKCIEKNISTQKSWNNAFYESRGSIIFGEEIEKKLRNLAKMATMVVKFNIGEEWIRALMDMSLTNSASRKFSECNYLDSLVFRLDDKIIPDFKSILDGMTFKY